jgi:tetratricopeptide (TPR) repeat protein
LRGDGQIEALRLIDAEFGNLLTVAYGMLQAGRPRDSLAITGQLADYWRLGRNQSVGLQLLVAGLEADPHDDSLERLRALVTLPFAASTFAGIGRHESTSRQAAGMAARLGRRDLEDEALLGVGLAEAWTGRRVEGFETLGRVAGSAVNPWAAANARLIRSLMLILAGQVDAARRGVHALARQLRAAGDRIGEATAFMHLAVGLQRHGDPADAEEAARRSLELSGDEMPFVTMHSNYVLGLILDERRDLGGAELLRTVQIHFRHVGDLGCLNGVNRALADVSRRLGRDHEALELLREVVWLLPEVDQQETAASLLQVAEIYLARGHTRQAGVLGTAAANLIGGSGIGWNVRQRQRLDSVLEQSGGDDSPSTPIEDVIGVALHP